MILAYWGSRACRYKAEFIAWPIEGRAPSSASVLASYYARRRVVTFSVATRLDKKVDAYAID